MTAVETTGLAPQPPAGALATAPFTVNPGGPPEVVLTPAGETGYPGVLLEQTGTDKVPSQDVYVALPRGKGLRFVSEGGNDYLLTVMNAKGQTTYRGILSSDGRALTFENVDPALSGKGSTSTAWLSVKASDNARLGATYLTFCVGDRTSGSTSVRVVDHIPFSVAPGGPPDVTLDHAHPVGYPGVVLTAGSDGTVSAQDVYVALPWQKELQFFAEGGPGYLLTVQDKHGNQKTYHGIPWSHGQALTFQGVDPALSGAGSTSVAWVAVKAVKNAPPSKDPMTLTFCVGDRASASTPVQVDQQP
ncbi:hypothetical protein [Streptomyces albireticuli]|uniref:Uncharacterized protein n=1 Tax=Streptomyces albireticuli TaxID=1940 RepID=A0A2A2DAY8_9ACTN|nr:hypothetical protein [Streptomyces albireticuli]MCD9145391.1 hypothetical protein [Streptomyces albireticuli]MCD9165044.1 hypothetical protein [Streptomyces albireticuli]MCD9195365.1 hypothetical protein [Streptomyces albireticuli]PAU49638.1 hypothetical protein CK936_06730 [Streptomyces albireticuli]